MAFARVGFEVIGVTPLIMNCFAGKTIIQMLAKHMNLPNHKTAKVPRELIQNARVLNELGQDCVPCVAVKKAMLSATTQLKSLKKTTGRISFFVEGQSLPIAFKPSQSKAAIDLGMAGIEPRMDITRCSGPGRTPDVRFRPQYNDWSLKFVIQFNSDTLSAETIQQLVDLAGRVGLGEWRPERDGTFGQFKIGRMLSTSEINGVIDASSVDLQKPEIPVWALDASLDTEALARMFEGGRTAAEEGMDALKGKGKKRCRKAAAEVAEEGENDDE